MNTIRQCFEGDDVKKLTQELVRVGLLENVKSVFDYEVSQAVHAWQTHAVDSRGRKLKVDGIVGPLTWSSFSVEPEELKHNVDFDELLEGGSPLARLALKYALGEMNRHAREIGGNNAGPFVDKYHEILGSEGRGWAWCAAFTSWCFKEASKELGIEMPFEATGGAQAIYNQLKASGHAILDKDDYTPLPGDICVWWRGASRTWKGHVGIVWGYKDGILYVVEGNVGRYPARVGVYDYVLGRMKKLIGFCRV